MAESFFEELELLDVNDALYQNWIQYALSLSRQDIIKLVEGGLTHQARSLRSMIREVVGSRKIPISLARKIDLIVELADQHAMALR